jgi:predicted adenine nucleotide alpha hydrolase (AANH) superfamily ATPase
MQDEPEGGRRCMACIEQRLEETARMAGMGNYDYFCTTLSISPLKSAYMINTAGRQLERLYGVKFLPSDFKKKDGYKKSVKLCMDYGIYRQNYCGCRYSL